MRPIALALLLVAALSFPPARADVVPPRAVEVAQGWLALIDQGRGAEAVVRYADRSMKTISFPRRASVLDRTIRSWTGHGEGDVSGMQAGGYFSLVFDATCASGPCGTDEVRLVPSGNDDWRVVGHVRTDQLR